MKCNQAIPVTPLNFVPYFDVAGEIVEVSQNDLAKFLEPHRGHPREGLTVIDDSYLSEGRYSDPMAKGMFEAMASEGRRFIVTVEREDINSPRCYKVQRGWLNKVIVGIQIKEKEITQQIKADLKESALLLEDKIQDFISCLYMVREARGRFKKKHNYPTDLPLVEEIKLSSESVNELTSMFSQCAHQTQLDFVKKFIREHIEDVLKIIVEYKIFPHPVHYG